MIRKFPIHFSNCDNDSPAPPWKLLGWAFAFVASVKSWAILCVEKYSGLCRPEKRSEHMGSEGYHIETDLSKESVFHSFWMCILDTWQAFQKRLPTPCLHLSTTETRGKVFAVWTFPLQEKHPLLPQPMLFYTHSPRFTLKPDNPVDILKPENFFTLERLARPQKRPRLAVKRPHGSGQKGNFFSWPEYNRKHQTAE